MSFARMIYSMLFISGAILASCDKETSDPPPTQTVNSSPPELELLREQQAAARAYVDTLESTSSDDTKWQATVQFYGKWTARPPSVLPDNWTKQIIASRLREFSPDATIWLVHFPGIVKHVELSTEDLVSLGTNIGNPCVPYAHIQFAHDRPVGESASQWVRLLTGIDFAGPEEFREWFEAHRERLRWDLKRGRFVPR